MPANLTPDYFKAEEWYRSASTHEEKILALEQMLAVMPKHKGTDHLQADLKRKLSQLREAATQQKKAGKHVDIFHVPKTGAGQVVLLGTPNSGKSAILAALTNAKVNVADFPFATHAPVPGMVKHEDVQIQLVDMPPVTADYSAPGQVGTYRHCDIIALVIDLDGDMEDQWRVCTAYLESKNLITSEVQGPAKKVLCLGTKADLAEPGLLDLLAQDCRYPFEFMEISTVTGQGLDALPRRLFDLLGVIRIYAKPPGKPADKTSPFTLPVGATVQDLARTIHRQLADKLKTARCWGSGVYDGQNVQLTHVLHDRDVVELHFA